MRDMQMTLAILGAVLGLAVTGSAVYTVWTMKRTRQTADPDHPDAAAERMRAMLMRWTALDYAVCALFAVGLVILAADIAAAWRDRQLYPGFHLPYLLSGVVFAAIGMVFMLVRLAVVLSGAKPARPGSGQHERQPAEADRAE